ncbi:putative G-protein coupled receptor [Trichinella pseudospiralis]
MSSGGAVVESSFNGSEHDKEIIRIAIKELAKCYVENLTLICGDEPQTGEDPGSLQLGFIGNVFSILVYRSNYLRRAAMLTLLVAKSYANLALVLFLAVETFHTLVPDQSKLKRFSWSIRPYTLFLLNTNACLAVWCTVAITADTYLCIAKPMKFHILSKVQRDKKIIAVCSILSCLLHVGLPVMLEVEETVGPLCDQLGHSTVIVLPITGMIILSAKIAYNLHKCSMRSRFSQQRQCMLRITIATAFSYWVLESPSLCVFIAAALRGSQLEQNISLCLTHVFTNFLCVLNVVAPFFVNMVFNRTFRKLLMEQLLLRSRQRSIHSKSYEYNGFSTVQS